MFPKENVRTFLVEKNKFTFCGINFQIVFDEVGVKFLKAKLKVFGYLTYTFE